MASRRWFMVDETLAAVLAGDDEEFTGAAADVGSSGYDHDSPGGNEELCDADEEEDDGENLEHILDRADNSTALAADFLDLNLDPEEAVVEE